MHCFRLFISLLLFLLMAAPCLAQLDPEGWDLAQKLDAKFQANDRDGFVELFRVDANLSRRAYLSSMEMGLKALHEGRDEEGGEFLIVATAIAFAMEKELKELEPGQILKAFQDYDPEAVMKLLDYSEPYYPGYRESMKDVVAWLKADVESKPEEPQQKTEPATESEPSDYNDLRLDPAKVSDDYFKVARPYLVKLQRIAFAGMFADQSLVLQELETFPIVEEDVRVQAETEGLEAKFSSDFAYVAPEIDLAHLRLLAEMGLLDEFDSKVPVFLASATQTNSKLGLLYTAFKVALRTQAWDQAESYLTEMAKLLKTESSPVFSFTHRSAEFQLKLAQGYVAQPDEVLAEFKRAWAMLDSYKPIIRVEEDVHWHSVRESARFWLDQLTALDAEMNVEAVMRINEDCSTWLSGVDRFEKTLDRLNDKELLFYSQQMQGYLTVILSNLDIVMYIFETWKPMLEDRENYAEVVQPFPTVLDGISESAAQMSPTIEPGPGFPEFELRNAFLLSELRARSRYLLSLDPANSPEKKLDYLMETAKYVDLLDQPESFIDYQLLVGKSFSSLGKPEEAIKAWSKAYDMASDRRFVRRSLEAATYLAEEYGQIGNWEKAEKIAAAASKKIEEELDSTSGRRLAEINTTLARIRAKAAVESDSPEDALVALTQNQQVQEASLRLRGDGEGVKATQKLQAKRKSMALLSRRIQQLESRPSSATRDELLEKTQELLAQSKSDFLLQSRKIRKKFSKLYTTALRFDPLNLPDIQDALPPDAAVVQYFPTENELYIFVVSQDKFRLRSVKQKKVVLDRQITAYVRRLKQLSEKDRTLGKLSRDLYGTLIAPIADDVAGAKTLVLIPAGKLNLLPFASLQSGPNRFLLDEKVLLELAKPTDFLKIAMRKRKPIGKVVAFANATLDLPAAEAEGAKIQEVFPDAEVFMGLEASRANLMSRSEEADILHLATHGTWDAEDSLKNHLKLSNNEKLAQEEIFDLTLDNTSIVTLSACNTALGELGDVDYVASLAEAFWIAGSDSVVASLWQVEDESTSIMMGRFYEELKKGQPRGEALRTAQLAVRTKPGYEHPYFWSGFLLFGDYR